MVRFSRSRRRYERTGLRVEEAALGLAEQACLADEEARSRRRQREEQRRAEQDLDFQAEFAREIRRLFPGCPAERAEAIAQHAGAGRALDPAAITLAVVASVRHIDTPYDTLLMSGLPGRTPAPRSTSRSRPSWTPGERRSCAERPAARRASRRSRWLSSDCAAPRTSGGGHQEQRRTLAPTPDGVGASLCQSAGGRGQTLESPTTPAGRQVGCLLQLQLAERCCQASEVDVAARTHVGGVCTRSNHGLERDSKAGSKSTPGGVAGRPSATAVEVARVGWRSREQDLALADVRQSASSNPALVTAEDVTTTAMGSLTIPSRTSPASPWLPDRRRGTSGRFRSLSLIRHSPG